jgi:hypothetical protein
MLERDARLIRSLIKSLDALQASIHQQAEAISEYTESPTHPEEPGPPPTLKADVSLPPAVTSYYDSAQRERQSTNWWHWIERGIAVVALIAAVALAILTYCTLRQIKRQADSADGMLAESHAQTVSQNRAVLVQREAGGGSTPENPAGVKITLENAGHIGARLISITAEYVRSSEKGDVRSNATITSTFTVGPSERHDMIISLPSLPRYVGHREGKAWYAAVGGDISYDDGFGNTSTLHYCATYNPILKRWSGECGTVTAIKIR